MLVAISESNQAIVKTKLRSGQDYFNSSTTSNHHAITPEAVTTNSQNLSSALTVISVNIEGLSAVKASMLSDLCKEQHCHCLCL